MKGLIHQMDKAFESRVRLGLMSVLSVNEWLDFNELKALLDVTDGNLASHVSALEKKGFIETRKRFIGKKTNTSFRVTEAGRKAFDAHLQALEELLRSQT